MSASSLKLINFVRGWPAPSLLPSTQLLTAANRVLTDPSLSVPALQYAPDPGPLLLPKALSSFLSSFYQLQIPIERIATTGGASQNFGIALGVFTDPGFTRRVWVLQPTYFLAFRIVDDAGLKVEGVEDAEEGIDFAAWEKRLEAVEDEALRHGKQEPYYKPMPRAWPTKIYKNVFYCVPSFSNPTGRCMTLRTREKMVRLARKFDALIVTDDVYDCLWWDARPKHDVNSGILRSVVPRLLDVDRTLDGGAERAGADGFGNAMSNGSFSKICGPGVRTGWAEGTPALAFALSQAGPVRSGGASSNLTGVILSLTLDTKDLQNHISQTLVPAYSKRWRLLVDAVETHLGPLGVTIPWRDTLTEEVNRGEDASQDGVVETKTEDMSVPPYAAGGYFIWIKLPPGVDATDLAKHAKEEENMILQTEAQCRAPVRKLAENKSPEELDAGDSIRATSPSNSSIRLCFAWEDEAVLVEGVERIARALAKIASNGPWKRRYSSLGDAR